MREKTIMCAAGYTMVLAGVSIAGVVPVVSDESWETALAK